MRSSVYVWSDWMISVILTVFGKLSPQSSHFPNLYIGADKKNAILTFSHNGHRYESKTQKDQNLSRSAFPHFLLLAPLQKSKHP